MKKITVYCGLLVSLFSLSTVVSAAAYRDANAFWSSGGYEDRSTYSNIQYYVPSDANSLFGNYIQDAISDFSSISGVDFGYSKTSDLRNSDLMIFNTKESAAYNGLPGIMLPCDWSGSSCNTVSYESYWDAATILLFDDYMTKQRYSSTQRNKTVVHEFGHVYSLKHQDDTTVDSVMVPGTSKALTSPTSLDISNLQWKY